MRKEGKGVGPRENDPKTFHKEIERCTIKVERALIDYQMARPEERARLKAYMDEQIQTIQSAIQEIPRSGARKQEVKIELDYKSFIESGSDESYSALQHDLQTLREYNI